MGSISHVICHGYSSGQKKERYFINVRTPVVYCLVLSFLIYLLTDIYSSHLITTFTFSASDPYSSPKPPRLQLLAT
jgi:hypothetical protein